MPGLVVTGTISGTVLGVGLIQNYFGNLSYLLHLLRPFASEQFPQFYLLLPEVKPLVILAGIHPFNS